MARDDRFKKVSGAGADFLETARAKAEDFLKELSRTGGDTQGRAQGAFDELRGGGRRSTEQLVSAIRKEIQNQLGALGLATKADLEALERRLTGRVTAAETSAARSAAAATTKPAASKTSATKAPAAKAPASKTPTKSTKTAASPAATTVTGGGPANPPATGTGEPGPTGAAGSTGTTPRKTTAKKAAKKATD